MGYGAHYLAKTARVRTLATSPTAPCPSGAGRGAVYLVGVLRWPRGRDSRLAAARGWLWPTVCIGVGAALITIRNGTIPSAATSASARSAGSRILACTVPAGT